MNATGGSPPAPALGELLVEAARRSPDAPHAQALGEDGRLRTSRYAESLDAARGAARALLGAGLGPGDRVAVLGHPSIQQIQAIHGVWLAGGTLVPLDPQWDARAHERALRKARVRFGIELPGLEGALSRAGSGVPDLKVLGPGSFASSPAGDLPPVDPATAALVLFTSGTTGEPKGVVQSHRSLGWNVRAVLTLAGAGPTDNLLSLLPLHHIFGLLASVLLPPAAGARVTFPASLRAPDITRALREHDITLVAAVPQLLHGFDRAIRARVAEAPLLARTLFRILVPAAGLLRRLGLNAGPRLFRSVHRNVGPRLRFLGSAGAALDPEVARRLWALGFNVVQGYGLTETGPAVSFDRPAAPCHGSVGPPLPGVEVRILEPGPSGEGEIAVRSPSLFEGYLDDPAETAACLDDGWLLTGDLGRRDREGRLFITGRKKEVIVLGSGKNVYPHEVEARLDESPFIVESCVVGLRENDRPGTERLHALVVPRLEAFRKAGESRIEVTLRDEVQRIADSLPSHHRVAGVTVSAEPLPRTPLGKLRRYQVLAQLDRAAAARGPRARPVPAAAPASPWWDAVESALRAVAGRDAAIHPGSGLELDLGLDSLRRIEVLTELERRLGTALPEDFAASALTAGDLLEEVERHQAAGGGSAALAAPLDARAGEAEMRRPSRRVGKPFGVLLTLLLSLPVRALAALWRFRVSGTAGLPRGAFLICPNHGSYLDAIVIYLAVPLGIRLRVWALGDHGIFSHPVLRVVSAMYNVIRVKGGPGLRASLEAGAAVLRSGLPLILFPEGARAAEGERLAFQRGAALLARNAGVPIVPAWLEGVDRVLPRGRSWPRLGPRVAVRFGPPLDPREVEGLADPEGELTRRLELAVRKLGEREGAAGG